MNAVLEKANELPDGWQRVAIEDIADVNPRVNKSEIPDELVVSFVPMPAVQAESGAIDVSQERTFSEVKKGFTPFIEGDVLFAKITPCMENGKMAVVPKVKNGYGFGTTEFHVLRPKEGVESKYLYYFVSSRTFRGVAQHNMSGAVGQKRVPTNYLKQHLIPVAPPEQQKRIATKIEELFSHIDAGIEALKKAKQLLKQYRQSVLKAAVTGELTKAWREVNKDKLEPASQLLERILKQRRQKWEEKQLKQFKAKGKMPKSDKWKEKYIEPEAYENGGYEIPDSWVMARAEQVCEFITKGTTPKKDKLSAGNGDVPFIKVYNLTFHAVLNFDINPTFTDIEIHNGFLARSKVFPGDVLMNIVGPPLGKVSIVPETHNEWNINQAIAVYRPITGLNNKLLAYFLLSKPVVEWMLRKTKTTAGQVNLTLEISRSVPIPIIPINEQHEIVRLVEEKLASSDRLLEELCIQQIKAEKNKQSILASAFSGQLLNNHEGSTEKIASIVA